MVEKYCLRSLLRFQTALFDALSNSKLRLHQIDLLLLLEDRYTPRPEDYAGHVTSQGPNPFFSNYLLSSSPEAIALQALRSRIKTTKLFVAT